MILDLETIIIKLIQNYQLTDFLNHENLSKLKQEDLDQIHLTAISFKGKEFIKEINQLSKDAQIKLVKENFNNIQYIKNPTEEAKLEAIK